MIGFHLMLDGVMREPITRELLNSILCELPERIGMKIIAGPIVVAGCPANPGWTGFVIIDKSHIVIHTFAVRKLISIDIYSCQQFDVDEVDRYLNAKINLDQINKRVVTRSEA